MANIVVKMKNGERREFLHHGRSGGSYSKTLELKEGWAIIHDEWGGMTAIPQEDIEEVKETLHRGGW